MRKRIFAFIGIVLAAVLLAACGKTQYEVSFDVAGGTPEVAAVKVESGKLVKEPTPAPTKEGHVLVGWYLGDKEWNFASDKVTGKMTLVAHWEADAEPVKYTVTFDTDGGSPAIPAVEVEAGSKVTKPADPAKSGFEFAGWKLGSAAYDFNAPVNANITLKAQWTPVGTGLLVEVAFDVRGGTPAIDPVEIEAGSKVTKPADPTRDGYNFVGWTLDGKPFDFNEPVTEDILLVAQWQQKVMVNVTLIADGGEPAPEMINQHEKGTPFAKPADMTKEGHRFVGWFNQVTDEEHNFAAPIEDNIILVAKWERVYENYTVTFDIGYPEGEEIEPQTVREELFAVAPEVQDRIGYRFLGWFEAEATEAFDFSKMILGDVDLVARWHLEHVATFDIGYAEGSNPAPVLVLDGEKLSAPAVPPREFYDFLGWYLEDEEFDFDLPITESVHLIAKWLELDTYAITYNNVDESMFVYGTKEAMVEAYLTDFYAFTKSAFSLNDFMHGPGKTEGFDGLWVELNSQIYGGPRPKEDEYNDSYFATSNAYKDKWMPLHDLVHEFTLIVNNTQFFWGAGTWTGLIRLRQYLVGIKPGGSETAEDMLMMPDPLIQNPPITEHLGTDAITLPEPYRVDAEFLGWYLEADFSGEAVTEIPANTKEDTVLYAKWHEIAYHDVTFDIGYTEGVSPATQNVLEGTRASKPADPARRPGFRFEGWFEADATEAFDFGSLIMAPVALEAKWREVVEYEVTFDYDTEGVDNVVVWIEEGEDLVKPTDPVKANYKFLGWFEADATEAFDFDSVINDDLVLKAKWEELTVFTITYDLPEGAEIFAGFATRDAMLQAFMEDFYQFLVDIEALDGEAISANDFIHGAGKTAGYDGMYLGPDEDTSYFQKLYVVVEGAANLDVAPETGAFINQPEYNVKWMPVMNQLEEYTQLGDASFFGSKYTAYRRFQPYLQGRNLWSNKAVEAAEIFATIPNEYAVPRYEYNSLDATFYLPQATHPELFFNGWYDNPEFDGEPIDKVVTGSTGNIELFANFGVPLERYKVEFDLGYDDLTLEDIFVTQGNLLSKPQDPVRHLYKFLGWALEGETELFNFEEDLITENSKLVAQWEELDPMTVTFDLGYEGGTPPPGVIVGEGTKVTKPADPVREGYNFLGWFLEDEEYDFDLPVEADITLVAKWEEAPFELTFDLGGGYLSAEDMIEFGETTHIVATRYYNEADATGNPITIGPGRTGAFWYTMGFNKTAVPGLYELVGKGTGYAGAADLYIYYHDAVKGSYAAAIKAIYGSIQVGDLVIVTEFPAEFAAETVVDMYFVKGAIPTSLSVIPADITELITPIREGYEFVGWFKDAELTEELTEVPVLTDDLTVYPKWEAKTYYEVTFDTDGGSEVPAQQVEEGHLVVKPADPVKEGYLFLGWLVDGVEYLFDEPVEADLTIVASWRALEEYDVTFDLAYDGAPEATVVKVTEFEKVTEPADPVREGHLFDGWFTDEELTQAYDFNTSVEADLTLYAKWREVITVEVTFDLNYEGAEAITPVVIEENTKVTKPADPVREGYAFLGWFEDEAETAFDFNTPVVADLVLEARWLEIEEYTITYELNGGSFLGDFADKDAMIDALLDDFYAYLELTSDMDEFKHGAGKTSGFDGTWHSVHKAKLYTVSRPSAVNEAYFISSAAYMEKWLPFFDNLERVVVGINNTQSFWGSTWTGLTRFREYVINVPVRPQHDWLPAEYFPVKSYKNIDGDIQIEALAVKEGVEFLGWYDNAELAGDPITVIPAAQTGNLTLYAKWQEATYYDVTFDSNGGSEVPSAQVEEGLLVLEPVDPTKENYVFVGWFVPDAETAYDFNTPVVADLVLEARWEEAPIVIYDLGEYGYLSEEDKDSLLWDFVGDYKDLYGRTGVTHEDLYNDFVAKSYIPGNIKDIFQPEYKNGKWAWIAEYFLYLANEANYAELDQLEAWNQTTWRTNIQGFIEEIEFKYYNAQNVLVSTSLDFSAEEAINGFWRFTSYNKVVKAEEDPLLDGNTISLWKEGYEFAGWYDNPEFDGEAITEIPTVLEGHYKLYAKWELEVVLPTISEVRDLATGTATEFIGIVTGIDGKNLFIEDATAAIYIYNVAALPEGLAIGDEVRIVGNRAAYAGLQQISGATVTIESSDNDLPALLEVTDLTSLTAADQAKRVEIEGLTVKSQSGSNLVLTNGTNDILVYAASGSAIYNHIQDAIAGQTVIVHKAYIGWFNGLQLTILEVADLEFVEPSDELKAAAAKEALALPAVATIEGLTLPEAGLHGTVITWASSHEAIIATDGTVVLPTEETEVTLTATITIGEVTDTKEFLVTVYPEGVTKEYDFIEDFEGETGLTASYANGSFVGAGGVTFTYGHSRDEEDTPIEGNGLMLRRASDSYIEFTLQNGLSELYFEYRKAFTGGSNRQLEIYINEVVVATTEIFGSGSGAQETIYVFEHKLAEALTGAVIVKIKLVGTSSSNAQAVIDNIKWNE